eukprot:TRINITY_DN3463_c0_g2_i1.p1 TRINITY_DN3463_c0_g2~~TRINITY_DN3463_c0_g2_i1.p1  ORF type:complete len:414 (+),score=126.88 TRINITY_DN3463_c0_g2_i1:73-1314(+)
MSGTAMGENQVQDKTEGSVKTEAKGPTHIEEKNIKKLPTVVLVVGMAGSGKTRFMHRMNIEMHEKQIPSFFVNLDPAVVDVPYGVNIDIRDTVNHKEVMKQYSLGPNGAIITSLNLFATRFDQVLGYIEQRQEELDYVFIDTPGQIEVFTWSASGQIIMETLASTFPTVVLYVVDTAKSNNPSTFMSNMMYSCGILYRTQLPLLLCLNKIDIADHKTVMTWMKDSDAFKDALASEESYSGQLTKSMAGVMQEFYANLRCAGLSAVTGEGVEELLSQLKESTGDYIDIFLPELKEKMARRRKADDEKQKQEFAKFATDIDATEGFKIVAGRGAEWDGPSHADKEEEDSDSDDEYNPTDMGPMRAGLEDDPMDDGAPPLHLLKKAQQEEKEEEEESREFLEKLRRIAEERQAAKK